jgi:hypothetical protein
VVSSGWWEVGGGSGQRSVPCPLFLFPPGDPRDSDSSSADMESIGTKWTVIHSNTSSKDWTLAKLARGKREEGKE